MSIKRKYRLITFPNGKNKLNVEFDDSNYDLLSAFFFSDYTSFGEWIDQIIEKVVTGQTEMQNISGNICELIITKNSIKVYDMLADDGIGNCCEIATNEMIELMKEWRSEMEKLK